MRPEASSNLENCIESPLCDDAGKASVVRGEVKIRKGGGGRVLVRPFVLAPPYPLVHLLF